MKFSKERLNTIILLIVVPLLFQCKQPDKNKEPQKKTSQQSITTVDMKILKSVYGTTSSGDQINVYRLVNDNQIEIEIIEFGAIVSRIKTPDKNGVIADITLGYDDISGWENDPYYFGATIGRVANRTGGAKFTLNAQTYNLDPNTLPDFGNNHLHGGAKPFSKVIWKGQEFQNDQEVGVVLSYTSQDMEEGYPGNLACQVIYSLNNQNELKIKYKATTDKTTIVNMTHHSYFNLKGAGSGNVFDQLVQINADTYTVADNDLIPTGKIDPVKGLPIDFITPHSIGSRMDQMKSKKFTGYDLNYVLNHSKKDVLEYAGKASDPNSGRVLEVYTSQACMHFYTSNFLEGKPGKNGKHYGQYGAFCFEPQAYPDAANKPQFDAIALQPGEKYDQTIIYKFSIEK